MSYIEALKNSEKPLVIAAPLANISHRAFRMLLEMYGPCDFFVNEMISAEALLASSPYEAWYTDTLPYPEKTVLQLVGANHKNLVAAAKKLLEFPYAGLDINMGCSAPALLRKGAGSRWLDRVEDAADLIRALRDTIGSKGLSIKLRMPDKDFSRVIDFCLKMEEAGTEAIAFHPRLRDDPWARPARQELFVELRKHLSIPLVLNGDIKHPKDMSRISQDFLAAGFKEPAGFMLGRALVQKPWFATLMKAKSVHIDRLVLAETMQNLIKEHQPKDFWITRSKKFFYYYARSFIFGERLAAQIQSATSFDDIMPLVYSYFEENPSEKDLLAVH